MAKQKMQCMELLTPLESSKEVVDLIQRREVLQLREYAPERNISTFATGPIVSKLDKYILTAQQAQQVLQEYCPRKRGLLASLDGRTEIAPADYERWADVADIVMGKCYQILALAKQVEDAKAAIARNVTLAEGLVSWLNLDIPMRQQETQTAMLWVGTLPAAYDRTQLLTQLAERAPQAELVDAQIIGATKEQSNVVVMCHRSEREEIYVALREMGFALPSDPTRHPPRQRYERYLKANETLQEEIRTAQDALIAYGETLQAPLDIEELTDIHTQIDFVIDYFYIRRDKYQALQSMATTDSVVAMTGYIPARDAEVLQAELEQKYTVAMRVFDPEDAAEEPPVLLENKPLAAAVESVTAMYSLPGKNDVDPNPIMSFFYYVFFGMMLADAGYGLLMVIALLIAKRKFHFEQNMVKTVNMFLCCGISTTIWGILFGGWFGDIIPVVAREFFGKEIGSLALWFEPVKDPIKLMLYSFLFGIIHLFVGLGIHFYSCCKDGRVWDAIFDVVPVYLFVLGLMPLGAGIFIADKIPAALSQAGNYLLIAGAVAVVLTAGRASKSIGGKLGGGLYALYNTASGYLGDILSYSRLLALGLSSGVIASVVNLMGTLPSNPVVKCVLMLVVFLLGHTMNLAINLIGTYVHTNRLQYVEFFSKFYEGGGKAFIPFKINTKHYRFKEET